MWWTLFEEQRGQALTLGQVLLACLLELTTTRTSTSTSTQETRDNITTAARLIFR
ncbi:hypothetical protein [Actinomadura violacea]|uniref:Uncharacterized protein n=1 Tax=Actinomadura violacea TaxID=2819934 RepID=A0ABS3RLE3_9ACTN|nr:hypothetical protein [Actinomadura violacea]MBO2457487.1 hypothetical protein [Actinomadura violacea]